MFHSIEYNSIYSDIQLLDIFVLKMKQLALIIILKNLDAFKSSKYKAKPLGHKFAQTIPNTANVILKNAATSVTLTYEDNFWRSLEMPLINCKI